MSRQPWLVGALWLVPVTMSVGGRVVRGFGVPVMPPTPPAGGTGVAVASGTGVAVASGTGVAVGPGVGVAVASGTGVAVGAGVGVAVGAAVGVAVGAAVGVAVGAAVGVAVGAGVGVAVGAGVGVGVACASVQLSEFDLLDEMTVVLSEFTANTIKMPPLVVENGCVTGNEKVYVPARWTDTTT